MHWTIAVCPVCVCCIVRVVPMQAPRPRQGLPRYQMPEAVLELFRPRESLPYIPPPKKKKLRPMFGVSSYLDYLQRYQKETLDQQMEEQQATFETPAMRRERKRKQRRNQFLQAKQKLLEQYSPPTVPNATGDAQKTLFIARLVSIYIYIHSFRKPLEIMQCCRNPKQQN